MPDHTRYDSELKERKVKVCLPSVTGFGSKVSFQPGLATHIIIVIRPPHCT